MSDRSVTLVAGFAAHHRDLTAPQAIDMTRQSFAIEQDRLNLREKYFEKFSRVLPASMSRFFTGRTPARCCRHAKPRAGDLAGSITFK